LGHWTGSNLENSQSGQFFSLGAHGPIKEVHHEIYIYIYIYILLVVPSPQLITIPKTNAQHFFANYLFIKKQG